VIVRKLSDVLGTPSEVEAANWTSRRLLLARDGMGFSLHDTILRAGTSTHIHYLHHLEAVYCIEGRGAVTVSATGEVIAIEAGTVYALDRHDEHVLRADTDLRMVCVFNPPLTGREVHDEAGAYPPSDAEPAPARASGAEIA